MRCFCTHVATWNRWSCWRSPEGTCLLVVIRQNYMRHFDNSINSVQVPEGWGTHGTNGSAQGFLAAKSIAMLEWLTWFQVMYIEETKEPGGISVARSGHHGTTWDMLRTRLDSVITSNQVGGSPFLSNLWPAHQMSWVTFLSDTSILLIWHYAILWYVHICIYKHIHIYIRIYTPTPTYIYIYIHTANFKNNGAATVQAIYDLPCYPNVSWVDSKKLMDFLGPFPQVDVASSNAGPTKVIRLEWHFCFVWKFGPPWTIPW